MSTTFGEPFFEVSTECVFTTTTYRDIDVCKQHRKLRIQVESLSGLLNMLNDIDDLVH
jgi:hypothetical protein